MLTKHPNIVIAHAPKYARRKANAAAMPKAPAIVEARDPRRIRREPKAAPTRIVGGASKVAELSEAERDRRADAADRLFAEIKRRVAGG